MVNQDSTNEAKSIGLVRFGRELGVSVTMKGKVRNIPFWCCGFKGNGKVKSG